MTLALGAMLPSARAMAGLDPAIHAFTDHKMPELTETPDPKAREAILAPLIAFNIQTFGPAEGRPLAVLLRGEAGEVIGGLWGRTAWQWLFIEFLAVPEALRGQGLGRQMLETAEAEAIARGCIGAWIDTFNPAALALYERQGFAPFGRIPDYPPGHTRTFLSKRFDV